MPLYHQGIFVKIAICHFFGKYDFNDLLNLLQNWDSYGDKATTILAVILSRYQNE